MKTIGNVIDKLKRLQHYNYYDYSFLILDKNLLMTIVRQDKMFES